MPKNSDEAKADSQSTTSCFSQAVIDEIISDGKFLTGFPLGSELNRAVNRHLAAPKTTAAERAQRRKNALQRTKAIRTAALTLASELNLALGPESGDSLRYIKAFIEGQQADWTAFERVLNLLRKIPAGELPEKYLRNLISRSDEGRYSINTYALSSEFGLRKGGRRKDDANDPLYKVLADIYERGTGKKPACRKSGYEGKALNTSTRRYSGPFFRFVRTVLTVTGIRILDASLGRRLELIVIPAHRARLERKERLRDLPP
jgi:hypothetical protein